MTKIMVVDDEPDLMYTTKMMLEGEGYEVVVVRNGKECLLKIGDIKPDLVLLDIMMPGLDGWEVGKKIKEDKKTSHIPIVMFTVLTRMEDRTKSFQYSMVDAQIDKPFNRETLLKTIEKVLKKSK